MAFPSPYVTEKFTAYLVETMISNLSLAVWLTDGFTLKEPLGGAAVAIVENGVKAFRNLSGYHLFTDLGSGNYTVSVTTDLYLPAATTVDTSLLAPKNPVIVITLTPRPSYPFPGNATLVRGVVVNAEPVAGAEVTVIAKPEKTVTDRQGEFVLFFKGIKTEPITIEIKKGGDTKTVTVTIEEGKTVSAGKITFP
ncbi:MAG TPA: hypothetical protein VLD40_08255 [Dissulfurispiraceae bacterium]|nr:hypothetical protein [Dissulfurispiraceae bacterium]